MQQISRKVCERLKQGESGYGKEEGGIVAEDRVRQGNIAALRYLGTYISSINKKRVSWSRLCPLQTISSYHSLRYS